MRITQHPILAFDRGKEIHFTFNGQPMTGYEGETIAAALHAAGVKVLAKSLEKHRPRGSPSTIIWQEAQFPIAQ